MGCVQGKGPDDSPKRNLDRFKLQNGYVRGDDVRHSSGSKSLRRSPSGDKVVSRGNVVRQISSKTADDLVDGWPVWLLENVSKDALAGFVPKSADSYDKLAKVGRGTYSNVYKARDKSTGRIVALKKVRFDTSEPESVKFMAREIIMLKKLDHPNIIKLRGIATSRMQYSLYLVFDFMQSDLSKVITRPVGRLTEPQVKSYMQQLLAGLQHCHDMGILHRDIKGSNLLIDNKGVLKIADFGLSNFYKNKPKRPLTSRVVTLWYRAPELLLGSTDYGVGIDLWSAGCILAEMFEGRPIMPGRNEIEQLHKIFKLCGSPSEDYWKKVKPPATFRPPHQYKPNFQESFPNLPSSAFGLLSRLLALDPSYRGTAASALQSEFFTTSPSACDPTGMLGFSTEDDEPGQSNERRISSMMKKRSVKSHSRKVSFPDFTHMKEQELHMANHSQGLDTGNSTSSTSASIKPNGIQENQPHTPTPAFRSMPDRSKSEAHPNALKNIQNYPLLLASLTEAAQHLEESKSSLYRRSYSNIDFRNLDLEKISKLFGLEDN